MDFFSCDICKRLVDKDEMKTCEVCEKRYCKNCEKNMQGVCRFCRAEMCVRNLTKTN